MAIDIRAKVTVSVGGTEYDVISGSISDEHVTAPQAILTKGQCEIVGTHLLSRGTAVSVYYEKLINGIAVKRRVPRALKLFSATPDPLRNKTLLSLGSGMAYVKDRVKDEKYINQGYLLSQQAGYGIVVDSIRASEVFSHCLGEIGLFGAGGLTNRFSRPDIDLSSGYLNVAAGLAASESLFLVGDSSVISEVLTQPFPSRSALLFLLRQSDLVDYQPLRASDSLPNGVEASYSRVVLKDPDTTQAEKVNWELDETTSEPQSLSISYKNAKGELKSLSYVYTPYSRTVTTYDLWDRVTKRVTTERVIGAQIASSFIQQGIEWAEANPNSVGGQVAVARIGSKEYEIETTQEVFYKVNAPIIANGLNIIPKPGYDIIEKEVTTRKEPAALLACSVASSFVDDDNNLIPLPTYTITASITTVTYHKQARVARNLVQVGPPPLVRSIGLIPANKTITETKKCYGYTNEGQQDLARRVAQGQNVGNFIADAMRLAIDDIETRVSSGREVSLQARPDQAERVLNAYADTPVTNSLDNGYQTTSVAQTTTSGSASSAETASVSVPYVDDDIFNRSGVFPNVTYTSISRESEAAAKARQYARTVLAIARGTNNGISVITTPEKLSASPLGTFALELNGYVGRYMQNGTTYTFDAQGIVASTDGVLLSGLGQFTGASAQWFPTATGTTFYADPPVTIEAPTLIGSIQTVGSNAQTTLNAQFTTANNGEGVYEIATNTFWAKEAGVWVNKGTRLGEFIDGSQPTPLDHGFTALQSCHYTKLVATSFAYGMTLPLISVTLKTGTKLQADKILKVEPPVAAVTVMANAPVVAIGAAIAVPAASLTVSAVAPAVVQSTVVALPTAAVTVSGFAPQQAGPDGVTVTVPLSTVTLTGVVPEQAGPDTDTFFSSYYRQVYGWEPWIFPDWWAD